MRTATEIRTEAKQRRNAGDWDVPDLVKELDELREQRQSAYETLAIRLTNKVRNAIKVGIRCGPHWKKIGLKTTKEIFDFAESCTKIRHELQVRKIDIDMPQFDDYPIIDLFIEYKPEFAGPCIAAQTLINLFEFEKSQPHKVTIHFGTICDHSPLITVVGKFESVFCHVSIYLGNKVGEK